MTIIIGSARIDENGKLSGGDIGDQKQKSSTNDTAGEVSMQNFYVHSKGWYILRPKDATIANKIAENMRVACNNANIGYDQSNRLGVITYGVNTKVKTECDCSSLVRQCVKEASGKDPGNFNTTNEKTMLEATGLFESAVSYSSNTTLYTGDVLVTKSKGHTVIVVSGVSRATTSSNSSSTSSSTYTKIQFIKDVQTAIGAKVDGIAGNETYNKCPTVSKTKNNKHAVVKPLQKYLNSLGYDCGTVDGIAGVKFDSAVKAFQKANGCTSDGEFTKNGKSWKKILGL